MITLYGIPNCDTVRKARKWLESKDIPYRFHDFRKEKVDKKQLFDWARELGWDRLLNRRGTTWRRLDEAEKADVDEAKAVELMARYPAMIKRPVFDLGTRRLVGFAPEVQKELEQL